MTMSNNQSFNLANEAWIPVKTRDELTKVSLLEAFTRRDIVDLSLRPDERISVMRLLLCIARASIPQYEVVDRESLTTTLPESVKSYLTKWIDSFWLHHESKPFLQYAQLKAKDGKTEDYGYQDVTKLDFTLATGSNSTHFDTGACLERTFTKDRLAVSLLTYQAMSVGGRCSSALLDGKETPMGNDSYAAPATAGNPLYTFVLGNNLLQSIILNLPYDSEITTLTRTIGRPVWEDVPSPFATDSSSYKNATCTYLGRLTCMSRAILLNMDCRRMLIGNALIYPAFPEIHVEPFLSVEYNNKSKELFVQYCRRIDMWREVPAILQADSNGKSGVKALQHIPTDRDVIIWCGGLITNKSKIIDLFESFVRLPAGFRTDTAIKIYTIEVSACTSDSQYLAGICKGYRLDLDGGAIEFPEIATAARLYWQSLSNNTSHLETYAVHHTDEAKEEWYQSRKAAMFKAFAGACSSGDTRHLKAYVQAMSKLQKHITLIK